MPVMQMDHQFDPKQDIFDRIKESLADIEVLGAQALVGIYVRPQRTASGLYLTDKTRDEDKWQGKVGLLLKLGAMEWGENDKQYFGERLPQVGDWVAFTPGDGWPMEISALKSKVDNEPAIKCRLLADRNRIKLFSQRPDILW